MSQYIYSEGTDYCKTAPFHHDVLFLFCPCSPLATRVRCLWAVSLYWTSKIVQDSVPYWCCQRTERFWLPSLRNFYFHCCSHHLCKKINNNQRVIPTDAHSNRDSYLPTAFCRSTLAMLADPLSALLPEEYSPSTSLTISSAMADNSLPVSLFTPSPSPV